MLNIFEHFLQGTISDFEKCERRTSRICQFHENFDY